MPAAAAEASSVLLGSPDPQSARSPTCRPGEEPEGVASPRCRRLGPIWPPRRPPAAAERPGCRRARRQRAPRACSPARATSRAGASPRAIVGSRWAAEGRMGRRCRATTPQSRSPRGRSAWRHSAAVVRARREHVRLGAPVQAPRAARPSPAAAPRPRPAQHARLR
ncbi:hypothetical protein T492DRAFT_1063064 [Pavlovales sp. CCMP2436]|nr:hypothetical protein T492DRAFT_1063064 [Pavlovales sp. CCMP2436]